MNRLVNHKMLYYERCGEGKPLILLHGNGEDHRIFDAAVPLLSRYFTVYALDSRGHGQSEAVQEYHYTQMAQDVKDWIEQLGLKTPYLYGFSDGGIIGLLLASQHPKLLSQLIISGANCSPEGIRYGWRKLFGFFHFLTQDPKLAMMLREPNLTLEMLKQISIPVSILAGSRDMIKRTHTHFLAEAIPNSTLRILQGETHSSYVIHSEKIAKLILEEVFR